MIRYPNIIGKTDAQKLDQMKSYLHQLVDELNFQLEKNSNNSNDTVQATTRPNSTASTKSDDAISSFNEIKGLIIKSADIVDSYSEQISKTLKGEYVAVSDFGTYTQDTLAELEISADAIKNTITKVESIDEDIKNEVQSEVKQTAESISLSVDNGETTAQIVLKVGDREIPATIYMKGLVTFSNLLTSDGTTQINGHNIITGKISSKDGKSLVLDLDAGTAELTGKYKTTAEIEERYDGKVYYTAELTGSGLVLRRDGKAVAIFDPFRSGMWSEDTTNRFVVHPQSTNYGDGSMFFGNDHASIEHKIAESFAGTGFAETVYKDDYGGETKIGAGYVSGLNAPTNLGDAVNKQYVDDGLAGKAPMSHVDDKDNPHGVTAAQVGAAPAGYGLGLGTGDITQLTTAAQVDAAMEAGWYQYYGSNINGNGTAYGGILVVPSMWSVTQFFFCRQHYGSYMKRIYQSNAWNPWEWINPPMLAGVEYRTTDRINGKAVYKRKTDNGYIEWRLDGETKWNRYSGIIGGIQQAANYYSSGKSANDLGTEDSLALIPCNTTTNPELYAIIKSTYAYVLTVYYATINQRAQIAISYAANPPKMAIRTLYGGTWTPWTEISNGMLYGLDTGAITIASGTSKDYTDSASKFYNVTVQIGDTAYRHTFVVDRNAVNNATNKQIGYYSDAMGKQLNLVVKIDGTSISFKPSGCSIVHIGGYY